MEINAFYFRPLRVTFLIKFYRNRLNRFRDSFAFGALFLFCVSLYKMSVLSALLFPPKTMYFSSHTLRCVTQYPEHALTVISRLLLRSFLYTSGTLRQVTTRDTAAPTGGQLSILKVLTPPPHPSV